MKYKEEWAPIYYVGNELEGILLREYLEKKGFHPIFYSPSLGKGRGEGQIFVLKKEGDEARKIIQLLPRDLKYQKIL